MKNYSENALTLISRGIETLQKGGPSAEIMAYIHDYTDTLKDSLIAKAPLTNDNADTVTHEEDNLLIHAILTYIHYEAKDNIPLLMQILFEICPQAAFDFSAMPYLLPHSEITLEGSFTKETKDEEVNTNAGSSAS